MQTPLDSIHCATGKCRSEVVERERERRFILTVLPHKSFMVLQTVLLLVQPLASMYHRPQAGLICKYFYRAVLFWSILYAIFPREAQHYISYLTHFVSETLGLHNTHRSPRHYYNSRYPTNKYYSSSSSSNTPSSNYQQWIL